MKLILQILILACSFTAYSQTSSMQKSDPLIESLPEKTGMSSERLSRIDSICEQAVSNGKIPGAVALIARNGKIVFWKAYGMADNRSGRPMKKDDIFRIASMSKAITATAVMMLWEEGKFRLDDPISKYIPEFKNPQVLKKIKYKDTSYTTVPATGEITIRQLLTHTSGLGYGEIDKDERFKLIYKKAGITDLFTTEHISIGDNIKKLAQLPLHHNPGEKYTYCEGLDVLGYFIEVISGKPFDIFLREHLFDPLGMADTWFYLPESKAERLVSVQYKSEEENWVTYPVTFYDPEYPIKGEKTFFSGGAGLCSTAKDYATFLQMYLNGGELNGKRFLSRTTIQTMLQNQTGDLYGTGAGKHHGIGFGVTNEEGLTIGGLGSIGTIYWSGYFNTHGFANPTENLVGILMKQTQGVGSDDTSWQFRLLTFQSIDD